MSEKKEGVEQENHVAVEQKAIELPTVTKKTTIEIDPDEFMQMKELLQKQEKQIRAYKMREKNPKVTKQTESKEAAAPEEKKIELVTAPIPQQTGSKVEEKPHYVGAWQRYCPTCGDPNPDFKDETECVDCHMHLGSKENIEKLKACPNCGSKRARPLV